MRAIIEILAVLFCLQACAHHGDEGKNLIDSGQQSSANSSMTKTSSTGMRHQRIPCQVNNEPKEGFSSQARHVEIGLSKDIPSSESSSLDLYSKYQDCDE